MDYQVNLKGKLVTLSVSEAALRHLDKTAKPLLLEVELYFSCLIKKSCHFREIENVENYVRVFDGLYLDFRARMTNKCVINEFDHDRVADFPIVKQQPYIPKWVNMDFSSNQWAGDFGYASKS